MDRKQKETVGLLQIGTFLEYFDLMLYVHMAVLLNDLFYPKTDPHMASLIAAFSFCSVYVLRPVGALIFGYIGDVIGRKNAIIISTMLMAFSCAIMIGLPTYEKIGLAATAGLTLCRALQGIAAQGELVGTEIYLVETVAPPLRYFVVSLTSFFSSLGGMAALGIYSLMSLFGINWRFAFAFGAFIAIVGTTARTRLHETPDFVDMKRRCKKELEDTIEHSAEQRALLLGSKILAKEKVNKKTALAYFFISCGFPVCFYYSFIHLPQHLKLHFNYSPDQILHHNLIVAIIYVISFLIYALLSLKIHPLKMLRFRAMAFLLIGCLFYYFQDTVLSSLTNVLLLQCGVMCFGIMDVPASGVFMSYFPIAKKYTSVSLLYAFSRITIYVSTSFGLALLTKYFDNYGFLVIALPISIAFLWGVAHFEKLENENKLTKSKSDKNKVTAHGQSPEPLSAFSGTVH